MGSNNSRNIIRIVAALYLGYLGIKLLGKESRESGILMPIIGVVFLLIAAAILYISLKGSIKNNQVNLDDMNAEADKETEAIEDPEVIGETEQIKTEENREPEAETELTEPGTEEKVD